MRIASSQGLGTAMSERLFRACFSDGDVVSDHERLSELAREVGVGNFEHLWGTDVLIPTVRRDEASARELGITGVPCILVDAKFMVSGAQESPHILDALRRAWACRGA